MGIYNKENGDMERIINFKYGDWRLYWTECSGLSARGLDLGAWYRQVSSVVGPVKWATFGQYGIVEVIVYM